MDNGTKLNQYNFISWGGIGDTLLMTPIFKYLHNKGEKVNVLATNNKYYDILFNNPHVSLQLFEGDIKDINTKNYLRPCYSNLLPGMFFKDTHASILMAKMLNLDIDDTTPVMNLMHQEIEEAKKILYNHSIIKFVAINPYTDDNPNKEWNANKWEKLVNAIHDKGMNVIQLGREDHNTIKGVDLSPKQSIRLSLAILSLAELFIGIDSFLGHAATALNKKSIILFGPTCPSVWGHKQNANIYYDESCSPCVDTLFRVKCPFGKQCLKQISVNDIISKI
jgi:hypothetical protein